MPVTKFGSTVCRASDSVVSPQGGFDIPERMFFSVKKEWESASRDNMGDVRELIPEFFYLPDFLLNSNHIELGQAKKSSSLSFSGLVNIYSSSIVYLGLKIIMVIKNKLQCQK